MQNTTRRTRSENSATPSPRLRVVRARALGWCFGVRDAVAAARAEADPAGVTALGELVHNADVTADLAARGFAALPGPEEAGRATTPAVLVTAHGAAPSRLAGLRARGCG